MTSGAFGSMNPTIRSAILPAPASAQSNTAGALVGKAKAGSLVTAEQVGTGAKRSVAAEADGTFRIGALPTGTYKVTYTDASGKSRTESADVSLGTSTEVGGDVVRIDKYVVSAGSINPVDFRSTEAVIRGEAVSRDQRWGDRREVAAH